MAREIERKFRVKNNSFKELSEGIYIHQGFLSTVKERVVRIRIYGDEAFITVKGLTRGPVRAEYEYPVPVEDAREMLRDLCEKPTIEKCRYRIESCLHTWELDEFIGVKEGLVIAEIELTDEDERFSRPDWLGEEVTSDPRHFNANLVNNPYKNWSANG